MMKTMNTNSLVDCYDPDSGSYFKSITKENVEASRFSKNSSKVSVVNIGIFNPLTNETVTVFPTSKEVTKVLFETGYNKKACIDYNESYSHKIRNNSKIEKRELSHKLLLSTVEEDICTLWKCDKDGSNLEEVATLSDKDSWHLDVKNLQIRVISSKEGELLIKSYPF